MSVLDPEIQQQVREKTLAAEIEFAANYRVFVEDPRAVAILGHLSKTLNGRKIPSSLSHGEVMFFEGMRAVYIGILEQIEKAGAKPV